MNDRKSDDYFCAENSKCCGAELITGVNPRGRFAASLASLQYMLESSRASTENTLYSLSLSFYLTLIRSLQVYYADAGALAGALSRDR